MQLLFALAWKLLRLVDIWRMIFFLPSTSTQNTARALTTLRPRRLLDIGTCMQRRRTEKKANQHRGRTKVPCKGLKHDTTSFLVATRLRCFRYLGARIDIITHAKSNKYRPTSHTGTHHKANSNNGLASVSKSLSSFQTQSASSTYEVRLFSPKLLLVSMTTGAECALVPWKLDCAPLFHFFSDQN